MPNNSPGEGSGWASSWPVSTGNDFLPNHMAAGIDYASIHMWPDNWGRTDFAFGQAWLAAHIADTRYLGKPLVLEEFGKTVGARSLAPELLAHNPVTKPSQCMRAHRRQAAPEQAAQAGGI